MSKLFKNYDEYIRLQSRKSKKTMYRTETHGWRREWIYKKMVAYGIKGNSILCIGSRHRSEVDFFEAMGFSPVIGIDLFEAEKIHCCDMSKMLEDPFLKDQKFDVVMSIESIEHCMDIDGFMKGLNQLCSQYFICMCPIVKVPKKWDCGLYPFMMNLKNDQDLKIKLESYFTQFSVIYCSMRQGGTRLFFMLKKK